MYWVYTAVYITPNKLIPDASMIRNLLDMNDTLVHTGTELQQ